MACTSLLSSAAFGQQDPALLEEIIVVAQKREEALSDVPISIAAISGAQIVDADLRRPEELSAYAANFDVSQGPISDKINIRGIQSGNQAGFEQSASTFVDDVYRGRGTQARWIFVDVERVEILRGPQPTFFGINTVAGALNISSAQPTQEFSASLAALRNFEFSGTDIEGYVSGPLSQRVRGRLAVSSRNTDDGWVYNTVYDQDSPSSNELFGRLSLEWYANDRTLVRLKLESGDFDVTGQPWVINEAGPRAPILAAAGISTGQFSLAAMGNSGFAPFGIPRDPVIDFGSTNRYRGDMREARLKVEHELANATVLTGIAAFSAYDFERYVDADFNPLPVVRFDDSEDFEQSSLELRLTSAAGGVLEYIGGLWFREDDLIADGLTQFSLPSIDALLTGACATIADAPAAVVPGDPVLTAISVAGLPGATAAGTNACAQTALTQVLLPAGVSGAARYAYLDQKTRLSAAYSQLTWNISDRWRAMLGLRYTAVDKSAAQGVYATDYVARSTIALTDQSPQNPQAFASFLLGEFTPHAFTPSDPGMRRDDDSLAWSLNLQWMPRDNTLLYASASTGSKAGGFNSFYMGLPQALGAVSTEVDFDDESVLSFEVGSKLALLDGRASLNVAAFRMHYEDLQVSIFSGNTTFVVQNAAEARSQGIEIDGRWQATDHFQLRAALGWVDFSYERFPNQGCVAEQFLGFRETQFQDALAVGDPVTAGAVSLIVNNQVCAAAGINDLRGRQSANAPETSVSLVADHRAAVGSYELRTLLGLSWRDEAFRQDDLDPFSLQPSFAKIDAVLSFGPGDGGWELALVGKNLTDEHTISYANDVPLFDGARVVRVDQPRNIALRARMRF